jgi:hypothetical protein
MSTLVSSFCWRSSCGRSFGGASTLCGELVVEVEGAVGRGVGLHVDVVEHEALLVRLDVAERAMKSRMVWLLSSLPRRLAWLMRNLMVAACFCWMERWKLSGEMAGAAVRAASATSAAVAHGAVADLHVGQPDGFVALAGVEGHVEFGALHPALIGNAVRRVVCAPFLREMIGGWPLLFTLDGGRSAGGLDSVVAQDGPSW